MDDAIVSSGEHALLTACVERKPAFWIRRDVAGVPVYFPCLDQQALDSQTDEDVAACAYVAVSAKGPVRVTAQSELDGQPLEAEGKSLPGLDGH